ncbi:hypothetical protein F2Q70_00039282 [Brassica cretica]|uniref:RNase H type-1 domain-containing protein n=1 Tax=Brassica cretica TaxID=69181 RepID=A0A8S9K239_BRACR|nr:hypothetical protein F2Q70_00039282 [Brassica cretica]KAF2619526.1 hypothetical protein F2Q68_00039989 [Brassica cretica]
MLISSAPSFIVLPPVGLTVPLWSWILWQLWNGRNKLCFENRVFSGMEIISKAIADAREWQSAQCSDKAVPSDVAQSHSRISSLQAPSPSPETVICNVDAAWDSLTLNCGIGCVFSGRKHCPELSPISDSRSLVSSALMTEAIAIRSAVMYAASSNVKSLMIRSDSQSLVKMLREKGSSPALFGILFDIYYFALLLMLYLLFMYLG